MPPHLPDRQPDRHGHADPAPPDAPADAPTLVPQPQPAAPDEAPAARPLTPAAAIAFAGMACDPDTTLFTTPNRHYDATPGRWLPLEPAASDPDDANLYLYSAAPATPPPDPEQPD